MPDKHGNPTAPGERLLLDAAIPVEAWPAPFAGLELLEELDEIGLRFAIVAAGAEVPATGEERADAGRIIELAKQLAAVIGTASATVHNAFRTPDETALLSELLRLSKATHAEKGAVERRLGGLSRAPSKHAPLWPTQDGATPHRILLTKTLPELYSRLFACDYTWSPYSSKKQETLKHTSGVRFVAACARYILDTDVTEQAVVSAMRHDTKAASR